MEKAPKPENKKGLMERVKGWKGWLMGAGIVAAAFIPAAAIVAAGEGIHIGGLNSYQDARSRRKKAKP